MGHEEVVVEAGADGAEVEAKRAHMMVRFVADVPTSPRKVTTRAHRLNVSLTEMHLS